MNEFLWKKPKCRPWSYVLCHRRPEADLRLRTAPRTQESTKCFKHQPSVFWLGLAGDFDDASSHEQCWTMFQRWNSLFFTQGSRISSQLVQSQRMGFSSETTETCWSSARCLSIREAIDLSFSIDGGVIKMKGIFGVCISICPTGSISLKGVPVQCLVCFRFKGSPPHPSKDENWFSILLPNSEYFLSGSTCVWRNARYPRVNSSLPHFKACPFKAFAALPDLLVWCLERDYFHSLVWYSSKKTGRWQLMCLI